MTAQDQFDLAEAMEQVRADQVSFVSLEKDLKELGKANLLSEIKDLKASLEHRLVSLSEIKKIYNVGPKISGSGSRARMSRYPKSFSPCRAFEVQENLVYAPFFDRRHSCPKLGTTHRG